MTQSPYKFYFPLSVFYLFAGLSVWPLNYFYPFLFVNARELHADFLVFGFLFHAICGFLLTAIPKFTNTDAISKKENTLIQIISIVMFCIFMFQNHLILLGFLIVKIIFLAVFVYSRIKIAIHKQNDLTVYIYAGLFILLISIPLHLYFYTHLKIEYVDYTKLIIYQLFPLLFIIGFGNRMIPMLTAKNAFVFVEINPIIRFLNKIKIRNDHLFYIFILIGSFFIEFFNHLIAHIIRFFLFSYLLYYKWRFFDASHRQSYISIGLHGAMILLILGSLANCLFPSLKIHMTHILFLGSFLTVTSLVETRVILAHGGHDLVIEKTSKSLFIFLISILVALLIRINVPIFPKISDILSAISALILILGILFWGFKIIHKVFKS